MVKCIKCGEVTDCPKCEGWYNSVHGWCCPDCYYDKVRTGESSNRRG